MTDTASIAGWLDAHAHRLRTLDPDDDDFSDLEPLREIVGDARVVTIGESAHLIHEFLLLRDRLVRFLVSQLGFTGFALESGFTEGIAVNDWVLGGDGEPEEVARAGITYGFGGCDETRALLRWMRSWNETHDRKVRYYGMDLPGGSGSMEPAVRYVLAYLDRVDPEYAQDFRGRIMPLIDAFRRDQQVESQMSFRELSQTDRDRLLLLVSELAGRMSAGFAVYAPRTSPESAELALHAAINAWQSTLGLIYLVDFQQPKTPGERLNPRDAAMRENIEWILQREDRLIVTAHNAHLQRAPMIAGGTSTIMLGQHLAALEDLSMVVIGTTYASGEVIKVDMPEDGDMSKARVYVGDADPPLANTIDALLDQASADLHLLDLRSVPDSGPVAQAFSGIDAMLVNDMALPLDPLKAFDALVHIRHVRFADADEDVWPQIERRR